MNLIQHFVNGKEFKGSSKRTSKVFNPATGEQASEVSLASRDDVNVAVQKAKEAFVDWSNKPPVQRARVIFKFKELIEKNLNLKKMKLINPKKVEINLMDCMNVLCVHVVQLLVQVIGGVVKNI